MRPVLRVLCVDDEKLMLQQILSLCARIPDITGTQGFSRARDALAWLEENPCNLALLDINLPDLDGILLAKRIKEIQPDMDIIFVTGYTQYALDAWELHARGYLLKPVTLERLQEEIRYVLSLRGGAAASGPSLHITVKTFGSFDVLVDGEPVHFQRAKAKELLAFLVDRQGRSITREEAFQALWEGASYDRPAQKQFDVIFRSLRTTLETYGISEILTMQRGAIRINPKLLNCDMYRFVLGDVTAITEYRGEYLSAYSWASLREAYLERRIEDLT